MSKIMRVGIIGAGAISQRGHIPGYRATPDVEVVALCDINEQRVRQVAEEMEIPRTYTDYEQMLAAEDLDLVSVCSPNTYHATMAIAALEAGAHVLCEKPMALAFDDAQAMVETARRAGRSLTIGHHMRHQPMMMAAKESIAKGELGRIYYAKASYLRRSGIPGYGSWFTNKDLAGGGAMMDIGCHILDLALWMLGHPQPLTVSASVYSNFGPRAKGLGGWGADHLGAGARFDVDDLASAYVRFAGGVTLLVEASWAGHGSGGQRLQLFGTEGGLEVNPKLFGSEEPLHYFAERDGELIEEAVDFESSDELAYAREISSWVAAIRQGEPPFVTREQGAQVIQIIEAVYKSAGSGAEVSLV